ncbi:LacI family DNA-binding transcriptional regulator [Pluralibacter gergoviae]
MANIRDVAHRAGVSVSTVSNVLNGRTDQMRKETLKRIEDAMAELGYSPNRAAQQLKTGQARMIGLLVPSIVNPSFAALAREVDLAAGSRQFRVLLGNTYRKESEESAFIEDMFAHGVRGIIVAASDMEKPHFRQAARKGMIMINYDSRMSADSGGALPRFDTISMDNEAAGRMAVQHLLDRGCRSPVFVTEATPTVGRGCKVGGFLAALREAGINVEGRIIEGKARSAYGDTEMSELGQALAAQVIESGVRPDSIVAINDALAIGLMGGLRRAGVAIPRDMSLVGIDNILLSGLVTPGLTSVMPPLREMAELMIDRLITRIDDPQCPPQEQLFAPQLIVRESVRVPEGENGANI